jgi:alkylhydroperoxidase family enzyme
MHDELTRKLTESILTCPGAVEPALRKAIVDGGAVPEALAAYVDKVKRHAYRVTVEDIEALKKAGYSEDAILEITLSAALGAALVRRERGLASCD